MNPKSFDMRGTIVRRRWGHGRGAFGIIGTVRVELGDGGGVRAQGSVYLLPAVPRYHGGYGPRVATVDLAKLHQEEWAPPFVSRLRRRKPR